MLQERRGNLIEVDIHGLTADDAKRQLEQLLSRAPKEITEIIVVHGYNGGQVLRDMVRIRLKHSRISARLISLNPGQTRLLLK